MDFFYIWLRRTLYDLSPEIDKAFRESLALKWDYEKNDGELIYDASRFSGDKTKSKSAYEDGMFRAFQACHRALKSEGRLVIVFAHKHPDAWETLVSAIIRAGFVVDGSWPIQTETGNCTRAFSSAALSSSIWLVCKKRVDAASSPRDKQSGGTPLLLEGLSESLREMVSVADTEEWEGKKQAWTGILDNEFSQARRIQVESVGLKFREIEQGVVVTFLHSQPIGQHARTRDLVALMGSFVST